MTLIKKIINQLVYKNPKSFRKITFKSFQTLNFILYFILIFPNFIYTTIFKYKISNSKKIKKVIIRNDQIGDCVLTLPFILGTISKENYYYISPLIEKIFTRMQIRSNWLPSKYIEKESDLFIANLSTADYKTFKNKLAKPRFEMIFSQLSNNFLFNSGFPIIFSHNYNINKSQTKFVNNCFKRLNINTDPINGIKYLNNHFASKDELIFENTILIVVGLGVDQGRKLNQNLLQNIIKISKELSFKPVLLEEPNYKSESNRIAKRYDIKTKKCNDIYEVFKLAKSTKYVMGFDCGPTHIASMLTNSILIFSHTPYKHWGKHIWHKQLSNIHLKKSGDGINIIHQINKGNLKSNWIISLNNEGCPLHKKVCPNDKCSRLNDELIIDAFRMILSNNKIK